MCLQILEPNPLSVASFANIFSHSVGCLFILFRVSFAVQKLSSLIRKQSNVHRQRSGSRRGGTYTQWNITQPLKGKK